MYNLCLVKFRATCITCKFFCFSSTGVGERSFETVLFRFRLSFISTVRTVIGHIYTAETPSRLSRRKNFESPRGMRPCHALSSWGINGRATSIASATCSLFYMAVTTTMAVVGTDVRPPTDRPTDRRRISKTWFDLPTHSHGAATVYTGGWKPAKRLWTVVNTGFW